MNEMRKNRFISAHALGNFPAAVLVEEFSMKKAFRLHGPLINLALRDYLEPQKVPNKTDNVRIT